MSEYRYCNDCRQEGKPVYFCELENKIINKQKQSIKHKKYQIRQLKNEVNQLEQQNSICQIKEEEHMSTKNEVIQMVEARLEQVKGAEVSPFVANTIVILMVSVIIGIALLWLTIKNWTGKKIEKKIEQYLAKAIKDYTFKEWLDLRKGELTLKMIKEEKPDGGSE